MPVEAPPEVPVEKPAKKAKSGEYLFLGKHRTIFAICLILAAAVHVLVLLVFGTYTLFKGSSPRMPFTSEGGVPAEDVGMEAPPEVAPETMEETAVESTPSPSDAPAIETDMVLAVSGMVSPSMSINAAPPVLAPSSTTGAEKILSKPASRSVGKASSVNFFGVKGEGTNVYFVVDASDSMLEDDRGGIQGFAVVKGRLKQMIQSLDEASRFNVVVYGASGADLFQSNSVAATPVMKKNAETFLARYNQSAEKKGTLDNNYRPKVEQIGLIKGDKDTGHITTRLDLGLLAAFEGLADTIFLISDGKAPVLAEDNRAEAQKALMNAEVSEADRIKYQKEMEDYRIKLQQYNEEIKKYREKYADKLQEKERREAENRAKGLGKVQEGKAVDYGVKISGLPPSPTPPKPPTAPQMKVAGRAPQIAGEVYDSSALMNRIKDLYTEIYKKADAPTPSIHAVGYMSRPEETKFLQVLAARNNGNFTRISVPIKENTGQ
jgi:hypothetical protein